MATSSPSVAWPPIGAGRPSSSSRAPLKIGLPLNCDFGPPFFDLFGLFCNLVCRNSWQRELIFVHGAKSCFWVYLGFDLPTRRCFRPNVLTQKKIQKVRHSPEKSAHPFEVFRAKKYIWVFFRRGGVRCTRCILHATPWCTPILNQEAGPRLVTHQPLLFLGGKTKRKLPHHTPHAAN